MFFAAKVSQLSTALVALIATSVCTDMLRQLFYIVECFFATFAIAVVVFSILPRLDPETFVGLDFYFFSSKRR